MSRVTKEIAREVAEKLLTLKCEEVKKLDLKIKEMLEGYILKKLPKEVLELSKKYPTYLNSSNDFSVSGNGFSYQHLNTINKLPCSNTSYEPTPEEAKDLLIVVNKKEDLRQSYFKLIRDIESLLYSLRTYNRVITEFPEAVKFLPNNVSDKLMVNVLEIRNQLK